MSSSNQGPDNYYQTYLSKRHNSDYQEPRMSQYLEGTKFQRNPSEYSLKQGRDDKPRESSRRQNYMISNLRSQLQNIKSQVVKLMSHDSPVKVKNSMGQGLIQRSQKFDRGQYPTTRVDRFRDNSSTSSFALSRPKPKPRLQEGLSKEKYFQLQNEILQKQLKNLKNKYVIRKNEFKQQRQILQNKICLLEDIITKNQQDLADYKAEIEIEIHTIRQNMIGRISMNVDNSYEQSSSQNIFLEKQNNELKQQVFYLKKRVAEANDDIKKMAIENNNLLKNNKTSSDSQLLQRIKFQFSQKLKQKDRQLIIKEQQIIQKQNIANDTLQKNNELMFALSSQRQNYKLLELQSSQTRNQNPSNDQNEKYQQLLFQYHNISNHNNNLQNDLTHLEGLLTNLKIENQELLYKRNENTSEIVGSSKQVESLTLANQQLNQQINMIKSHISGMVQQTAQQMSQLQMENQYLQNKISQLQIQNTNLHYKLSLSPNQDISSQKESLIKRANSSNSDKSNRRLDQLQSWKTTLEQSLQAKQRQISSLKSELRRFSELYTSKCKQVTQTQQYYSNQFQKQSGKQSYLNSLVVSFTKKLQQANTISTQTINDLKLQIQIMSKQDKDQETIDLKQLLKSNTQQIERLRQDIARYKYALDNSESNFQMQRTKLQTEKKNIEVSLQSQITSLKQDLTISNQSVDALTHKLTILSQQNDKKDELIGKYIKQKNLETNIDLQQLIFSCQRLYSVENIKNSLNKELIEIQRLTNDNIAFMKHLVEIQEKHKQQKS